MSVAPVPPSPRPPPRRPRHGPVLLLMAGVAALHALLLALLPGQRPPAARPGSAQMPALWARLVPAAAEPVHRAAPAPSPAPAPAPGRGRTPAPPPRELAAVAVPVRPPPAAPSESAGRGGAAPPPQAASAATGSAAGPAAPAGPADPDGDEPDAALAGGSPPPLYATRLPDPALLRYQLHRGPQRGQAQLRWQHDGERYTLAFDAQAGERLLFEQRSSGRSGAQGLAPEQFRDKRRGRAARQARFDADAGRIAFSTRAPDLPLWLGAQDRLGWIVQLAGIVAAAPAPPEEVRLFVVGARGGAGPWTFVARGTVPLETPLGPVRALHYERAPAVLRDQRVEAWLDPARGYWPVRLRLTPVLGGPPLELWLDADPAKP